MKSCQHKIFWITGASSGIGESLAYELSYRKYKLILSSRNPEQLERVKRCCVNGSENIFVLPMDLTKMQELEEKASEAWNYFGKIDCLIHNAGLAVRDLAVNTTSDIDREVMETNYFGPIHLTKLILPMMLKRNSGHIAVVSSLSGKYGVPRLSSYAASKHALHGFFDSLRAEVASQKINISIVVPGFIRTPIANHAINGSGSPYGKNISVNDHGMEPDICAEKIVNAILSGKEETYIGGREMFSIYLNRIFPELFSKFIRNHPVARFGLSK